MTTSNRCPQYGMASKTLVAAGLVLGAAGGWWSTQVAAQDTVSQRPGQNAPVDRRESNRLDRTQPLSQQQQAYTQNRNSEDTKVLTKMHLVNQMEIEFGDLAEQKGQLEDIRRFGQQLAADHRRADQEVQAVARQENIELPSLLGGVGGNEKEKDADHYRNEHQKLSQKLLDAQGRDFDKQFTNAMVDGHNDLIEQLKKSQDKLSSAKARDLVMRTLPQLETHKSRAEQLKSALG